MKAAERARDAKTRAFQASRDAIACLTPKPPPDPEVEGKDQKDGVAAPKKASKLSVKAPEKPLAVTTPIEVWMGVGFL